MSEYRRDWTDVGKISKGRDGKPVFGPLQIWFRLFSGTGRLDHRDGKTRSKFLGQVLCAVSLLSSPVSTDGFRRAYAGS
jgi:hypothetical protein